MQNLSLTLRVTKTQHIQRKWRCPMNLRESPVHRCETGQNQISEHNGHDLLQQLLPQ
jgi:hypothetical protein